MASSLNVGIGQLQDLKPADLIAKAQWFEELGYEQFWYGNEWFYRDMWIGLTVVAQATQRMKLGTFIAEPYARHPVTTAIAIATLDEVSNGRAMLLLGAGGAGAAPLRIPRTKPAVAMGDAITIIRKLLNNEQVVHDGEVIKFINGKLSFEARSTIPIYVASRGDHVLAKAGELADGVMIATHATPAGLRHGLSRVEVGAKRAGRSVSDLELFARVDGCIADEPREALESVRPMVARLLGSSYPDRSFVHALGLEVPAAFEEVAARRDRLETGRNAHLVPDELVKAFTWAGTAEQVAEQVAAVVDAGFHNVSFLPHALPGASTEHSEEAFAKEVRPRVEALMRG